MHDTTPHDRVPHAVLKEYFPQITSLRRYLSILVPSTDLAPVLDENESLTQLVDSVVVASQTDWRLHATYSVSSQSCGIQEVSLCVPKVFIARAQGCCQFVKRTQARVKATSPYEENVLTFGQKSVSIAHPSNLTLHNSYTACRAGSTRTSHSFRAVYGGASSPCKRDSASNDVLHTHPLHLPQHRRRCNVRHPDQNEPLP